MTKASFGSAFTLCMDEGFGEVIQTIVENAREDDTICGRKS